MAIPFSSVNDLNAVPADTAFFPIVQGGANYRVDYGKVRSKTITELTELTDAPENADLFRVGDAGTEKKIQFSNVIKDLRVTVPICISAFLDQNKRNLDENWNGVLQAEATGEAVSNGSPSGPHNHGIGKIVIVVNAGTDVSGTLTITGDTVDRNTGAVSAADTDDIVIDTLSTDASSTDAEGNTIHDLTNAYISSKWFSGSFTISTTDLNISDMDIYHVSFEQVNDQPNLTLQTFDMNALVTNASGWFYGYLYSVLVTGSKVNIQSEASLSVTAAQSVANEYYRLRRGNLGVSMDGAKDGFFVNLHFGPNLQQYWEDISMKVWFDLQLSLSNT